MYNRIKKMYRILYLVMFVVILFSFAISAVFVDRYMWISNLFMSIGTGVFASVLFFILNETTRKTYLKLKKEAETKLFLVNGRSEAIEKGYHEAIIAYQENDFLQVKKWICYFYEKMIVLCNDFEQVKKWEELFRKDKSIEEFIRITIQKNDEFEMLEKQLQDETTNKQELTERMLENLKMCYKQYRRLLVAVSFDKYTLNKANNRFMFD